MCDPGLGFGLARKFCDDQTATNCLVIPPAGTVVGGVPQNTGLAYFFFNNAGNSANQTFTFTEPGTGSATTLQFAFRNDPGFLGLDDVSVFMSALKRSTHFSSVELKKTTAKTDGKHRVAEFTIEAKVNPVTGDVVAAAAR